MSTAAATLRAPLPALTAPLIAACLSATWLVWGSTYLTIKWEIGRAHV